jgi:hypothetical protein
MGIIVVICLLLNFWLNSKNNLAKIQQQIEQETDLSEMRIKKQA